MRHMMAAAALVLAAPAAANTPEERLAAAGHVLPAPVRPVAVYATRVQAGDLLFLSGHGECDAKRQARGKLGRDLTVEEGRASAERVALCMLATIRDAVGGLDRVERVVRILGFVNASQDFTQHPQVMNGFSELFVTAFGEAGKGARSAVGAPSLPGNIAVEVEAVVQLKPPPGPEARGRDSQIRR
ncbi:RidA family protein [Thermaurantiacus tibetensis]|uniref:RidA family protein n=1 Tax=Thermaurantiacus tibetensis TaxID=2759035 RepID=UPI00188E0072|nr:RidA family protein [Thermaurantiacus tibetensis]